MRNESCCTKAPVLLTGKAQKRIVRASVVNLSENPRRPCPRVCNRRAQPNARSLHACRSRQTLARHHSAGRRRARIGLLPYIPRGTSPRKIAVFAGFGGQSSHSPCQKVRNTPQASPTTSIESVHACRANGGDTPPPPNGEKRSETGEVPPPPRNRVHACTLSMLARQQRPTEHNELEK